MTDALVLSMVFAMIGELIFLVATIGTGIALYLGYIIWAVKRFPDNVWIFMLVIVSPVLFGLVIIDAMLP